MAGKRADPTVDAIAHDQVPASASQVVAWALPFGRVAARVSALVAMAIGASELLMWSLTPTLHGTGPLFGSIKAWTAVCFVLLGIMLLACTPDGPVQAAHTAAARTRSWVVWLLAVIVAMVSGATIIEYVSGADLGMDRLLWHDAAPTLATPFPGRMGLNTALALLLLALAFTARRLRRDWAPLLVESLAMLVVLLAFLPMLGYLYGARALESMASHTQMALHTALLLAVTALALTALDPLGPLVRVLASDGPGGTMLRRLLPVFSLLLVLVSWLRLEGQRRGFFGLEVGLAIMIAASLMIFGVAAYVTALTLNAEANARATLDRELRDRELRYRLLVDATFDGMVVTQNGVIKEANAGYASIFGYEPDELPGRSALELVAPESASLVSSRISAGLSGRYSAIGLRKDGKRFPFDTVVRTHGAGPDQIRVAAVHDTTAQLALESQLRQAQKMEAIGQLAGGVAHDFNNLLTVILSYSSLLMADQRLGESFNELQEMHNAAQSAAALTRQLLAFSRQQVLAPRLINLNAVVAATEKLLRRLIGEDIVLRSDLADDLPSVLADPVQIEQVLLNLAVNSRDAMPAGGSLVIATSDVHLDAAYAETHPEVTPGRYVQVSVTDSGIGMDDATRARIFEPFFTTKDVGHGTGLGLASVYGIVQQSGGHIWVYSELGHGTTFRLYFPVASEQRHDVPDTVHAVRVSSGSETILLAEDAPSLRKLARTVLTSYGFTVLEASNGADALDVARAFDGTIHLLLTDVVMPGLGGRVLAEQLMQERPALRVLFISGYTRDTALQRGLVSSGMTLLQKPFTPDVLIHAVRSVLDAPSRMD